ncbi:MAG TPA: methyl-accepting chemotaxis protein [Thermoguttaceae bacterium]|nr:methyl-accepting chemotaxis protein [Thermoguttaceae bacterium]
MTTKLWIGVGGIVVFLVASLMGYQYATTATSLAFKQLLRTEVAMDGDITRAEASMLHCRRAEKDFLLERDLSRVAAFDEKLGQLIARCRSLQAAADAAGYADMAEEMASAVGRASAYGEAFHRVVASRRKCGLSYNTGLQGRLREAFQRSEIALGEHALDDLNQALSELREWEKDYLRDPTVKHGQAWREAAEAMRETMAVSSCERNTRESLERDLTHYQELQQRYMAARSRDATGGANRVAGIGSITDQIDAALDDMDRRIDAANISHVERILPVLRGCEKDYLLRGESRYARCVYEALDQLLAAIKASKADPKSLERARLEVLGYKSIFDEMVEEYQTLAAELRTTKDAVHQLEPIMQGLTARVAKLTAEKTRLVERRARFLSHAAMFAGIISGLLAVVLAMVLPPAVVAPIRKCTEFAQAVAQGDLGGRLEVRREDEMGRLAAALNQMAGDLGRMMQGIRDAAARKKAAETERAEQKRLQAEAEQRIAVDAARLQHEQTEADHRREREAAEQERLRAAEQQRQAQVLRRKVDRLLEVVAAAAEGNLTGEITVEGNEPVDELAAGLRRTFQELARIIAEVTESTEQFTEGSYMIAQSTQNLALGAQSQSVNLKQMNASIAELARSIEAVKENSSNADHVARQTMALAEEGGRAVQKSAEAMELMRHSSKQIGEIIQVISDIADQTNLLALNAAIEAARAGQHGLGFAVVADEVRKLAERSNQATDEIARLIRESTRRVEEGAALSDQTGKSLKRIIAGVETTAQGISQIAQLTVGQATIAAEVSTAVAGVSKITEQVTAGSEEMAASSEQLGANADRLKTVISRFRI